MKTILLSEMKDGDCGIVDSTAPVLADQLIIKSKGEILSYSFRGEAYVPSVGFWTTLRVRLIELGK